VAEILQKEERTWKNPTLRRKEKGKKAYTSSQTEGRMGKENIRLNYAVSIYCSNLKGNQWLKDKTFHNVN